MLFTFILVAKWYGELYRISLIIEQISKKFHENHSNNIIQILTNTTTEDRLLMNTTVLDSENSCLATSDVTHFDWCSLSHDLRVKYLITFY